MATNFKTLAEPLTYSLASVNTWEDDEPLQYLDFTSSFGLNIQINFEMTFGLPSFSIMSPCHAEPVTEAGRFNGVARVATDASVGSCFSCKNPLPLGLFKYHWFNQFPREQAEAIARLRFDPLVAALVVEAVKEVLEEWRGTTVATWPRPFKNRELIF